jgi:hypothetical protein
VILLTGELPTIIYLSLLITIPISWVLLQLYKRAVTRAMAKLSKHPDVLQPVKQSPIPAVPPQTQLSIRILDPDEMPKRAASSMVHDTLLKAPAKASLVYLLAGLGFAAIMTWGRLTADQTSINPIRMAITLLLYSWPIVLAVQYIAGTTRKRWLTPLALYWSLYLFVACFDIARNPNLHLIEIIALWGIINLLTTLAWVIVLHRKLRAVSPLVLIFLLLALTGALFMLELFLYNDLVQVIIATLLKPLGEVLGWVFVNGLIGLLWFCVFGWLALRWIRWQYQRQRLSDQIIILDALWLLFVAMDGTTIVFQGVSWLLILPLAFLSYKILVELGFRWFSRHPKPANPPCLLLLRVFSLGRRSEQLFDAVSTHWRYLGRIQMIAGPDLATTTIEPHEFLDYVSGRLGHNFIDSPEKLESALAANKHEPDRDGRYRVAEYFCYGDTWQMVMRRLEDSCEVVLMDLRGFSPQNQGCIFEINTLINHMPLNQVIFTVDETSDQEFLRRTIDSAWKNVSIHSPNRDLEDPSVTFFRYHSGKDLPLERLLETLCQAASGGA